MGQRIDDEIREHELERKAKKAAHIEKILTPEGFAETIEDRRKEFEREIKETLSLWLVDMNEPIWKQIEKLQKRITELEILVKGHPHNDPIRKEADHAD